MPNSRRGPTASPTYLRGLGLQRLDHYSIFMENNARYIECCGAGERSGLYFTCINSFLTPDELAYIVNNSESKVLIFSEEKRAVALEALKQCPNIELCAGRRWSAATASASVNLDEATAGLPGHADRGRVARHPMLYSSGTTGRPKGIVRPLPESRRRNRYPSSRS